MNSESLMELIGSGKEHYRCLLDQAAEILRNLDACGVEGQEEAVARRQESISALQNIDARLADRLEGRGAGLSREDRRALEEFQTQRELATKKILELDALVIALAEERLNSLKDQMFALKKGKTAFSSYERSGRLSRRDFNRTA